jgi:methionyl-tRNA formyltransferase
MLFYRGTSYLAGVKTAPYKAPAGHEAAGKCVWKKYAVEQGIKILQPEKLKNPPFFPGGTEILTSDIPVVVAYRCCRCG